MTTITTTQEIKDLTKRIKEIEAEPRALIGSDSGTHGKPDQHNIYEEISGERYATYSYANSNATRCTVEQAEADTNGRIRMFTGEIARMAGLRRELAQLKRELAEVKNS